MSPLPCPVAFRRPLLLALACCLLGAPLQVTALDAPTGKVLLSITGRLQQPHHAGQVDFDDAMLAALPQRTVTTRTPWDKAPRRFTGPLLRDVLAAAGAQGEQLRAVALNDYHVDIPVADARLHDVVVARLVDEQPVRVRDRGPLLIVYPFDTDDRLRAGVYVARSIWQLRRIEIQ